MADRGQDRGGKEETAGGEYPEKTRQVKFSRRIDPAIAAVLITLAAGVVAASIAFWMQMEAKTASMEERQPWILRYLEIRSKRLDEVSERVFRLEQMQMEGKR